MLGTYGDIAIRNNLYVLLNGLPLEISIKFSVDTNRILSYYFEGLQDISVSLLRFGGLSKKRLEIAMCKIWNTYINIY
jgi:hypothetical protein